MSDEEFKNRVAALVGIDYESDEMLGAELYADVVAVAREAGRARRAENLLGKTFAYQKGKIEGLQARIAALRMTLKKIIREARQGTETEIEAIARAELEK